jgi:hypothetical protein
VVEAVQDVQGGLADAPAGETGEATMKVTAVKVFTQNLADNLAPGSVLLLEALVVDALELLVTEAGPVRKVGRAASACIPLPPSGA